MVTVQIGKTNSTSSPIVTTLSVFNPDVLGRALPFGEPEFTLLVPGSFEASFGQTRLGDGWLSVGDTAPPIIVRMLCPAGFCLLGFLLDSKGEGRLNGQPIFPGRCVFAPAGSQTYYRTAPNNKWAIVYIPHDQLTDACTLTGSAAPESAAGNLEIFRPSGPEGRRLFGRIRMLWTQTLSGMGIENAASELTQLVQDFFVARAGARPDETPAMSHARFKRNQLLSKADAYLRANAHRPVPTMRELCEVTGAGEGALRYAFTDILGLTPAAYLRILRLNGIHQQLMAASPDETTVESVGRSWGYAKPAGFSGPYLDLFGETPAQTLQRSRRVCPTNVTE